jgi:hypothetical protein
MGFEPGPILPIADKQYQGHPVLSSGADEESGTFFLPLQTQVLRWTVLLVPVEIAWKGREPLLKMPDSKNIL